MSDVTQPDVIKVFGDVGDAVAAKIIATGATREQLAEARAWVVRDATGKGDRPHLPLGPVGHVVEIIERSGKKGSILDNYGSALE